MSGRRWPWFRLAAEGPDQRARADPSRWVVIDVETSGLDPRHDRLLSIGAVAVRSSAGPARIVLADSLELLVFQDAPGSRPNILVHGIGEQAQRAGVPLTQATRELAAYVGDSPLVAFHASFDRAFVAAAMKGAGTGRLPDRWLDLAELAPALHPATRARSLDEWLDAFGIPIVQRHDACADAFATAMLFLRLLADVPPAARHWRGLHRIAAQARWLVRPR